MKTFSNCVTAFAALVCAGSLAAHHSISMIEITAPIWVKGTVVRYEIVNPHTMIEVEERTDGGQVIRWTVEGPIIGRIQRMGVDASFLKAGDVIELCGFRRKRQGLDSKTAEPGVLPPYIHGHLLVLPNGRMRPWGPYGKLENCVRPEDRAAAWVEFLNDDSLARELWCNGESVPNRAELTAVAAEIHAGLTTPCATGGGR